MERPVEAGELIFRSFFFCRYVRFARNEELAQSSDELVDGDTIALITPVAGGA